MKGRIVRRLSCCVVVAAIAACGNEPTATTPIATTTDAPASTNTEASATSASTATTPIATTTDAPASTNTEVSTTSAPTTSLPSGEVPAAQSIEMETGTLHYTLPSDAAVDWMPMPSLPPFVIGYAKWFTGCCYLKITVQDFDPPMPQEEVVGTFASSGMEWTMYDTGPRDGTDMTAKATVELGTVLIGAQVRSLERNTDPSEARRVVEALARTVTTSAAS